ncbi:hypothetical protein DFJ74DRAFT_693116 [Hyaloraphidium curvatum]|nr:hypothetical protein DFJ74DRAFT_693116 [Hyaloraphidium curvatum]
MAIPCVAPFPRRSPSPAADGTSLKTTLRTRRTPTPQLGYSEPTFGSGREHCLFAIRHAASGSGTTGRRSGGAMPVARLPSVLRAPPLRRGPGSSGRAPALVEQAIARRAARGPRGAAHPRKPRRPHHHRPRPWSRRPRLWRRRCARRWRLRHRAQGHRSSPARQDGPRVRRQRRLQHRRRPARRLPPAPQDLPRRSSRRSRVGQQLLVAVSDLPLDGTAPRQSGAGSDVCPGHDRRQRHLGGFALRDRGAEGPRRRPVYPAILGILRRTAAQERVPDQGHAEEHAADDRLLGRGHVQVEK